MTRNLARARWDLSTLRELRDRKVTISLYCHQTMPECHGAWHPSIDQLIQYCGVDFDIYARRAEFLGMFRCERCGRPYSTMTASPYPSGGYNAFPSPGGRWAEPGSYKPTPAEIEQRAREENWQRAEAERNRRQLEHFKAIKKMEERAAKGIFDIGPPDPRKHWKARPKMKG